MAEFQVFKIPDFIFIDLIAFFIQIQKRIHLSEAHKDKFA